MIEGDWIENIDWRRFVIPRFLDLEHASALIKRFQDDCTFD